MSSHTLLRMEWPVNIDSNSFLLEQKQEAVLHELYAEARRFGMLHDSNIRLLFMSLMREFDNDIFMIVKERVERVKELELLHARPLNRFLPTRNEAAGEIVLGKVIGSNDAFGINSSERHFGILGSTGAGKSYCVRKIMKQLILDGASLLVISKKADARSIATLFPTRVFLFRAVDGDFKMNFKSPSPGMSIEQANTVFVMAFCEAFGLLQGSEAYLSTSLAELDELLDTHKNTLRQASLFEIYEWISRKRHSPMSRDARFQESILNRTVGLLMTNGPLFACAQGFPIEQALVDGKNIILEVDGLREEVALFITTAIIFRLFNYMLYSNAPKPKKLVIFLDDSQELFNINNERNYAVGLPIIGVMTARFRAAGLLVASTQVPSLTSAMLRQNCGTKVVFSSNNFEEALTCARMIGLPDNEAGELLRLKRGEAVIMKQSYPYPVKVKIDADADVEEDF